MSNAANTTAHYDSLMTAANEKWLRARNAKERRAAEKELAQVAKERRDAGK